MTHFTRRTEGGDRAQSLRKPSPQRHRDFMNFEIWILDIGTQRLRHWRPKASTPDTRKG